MPRARRVKYPKLFNAAKSGDVAEVLRLVDVISVNVNETDQHHRTALHVAAFNNHPEVVEILMARAAHVTPDKNGSTPLHTASFVGALESLRLIASDTLTNRNAVDYMGRNACHYAAMAGRKEALQALVEEFDVKLDVLDYQGRSPMSYAHDFNKPACAWYLREYLIARKMGHKRKSSIGFDHSLLSTLSGVNLSTGSHTDGSVEDPLDGLGQTSLDSATLHMLGSSVRDLTLGDV